MAKANFSTWLDGAPAVALDRATGDFSPWLDGSPLILAIPGQDSGLPGIVDTGTVPAGLLLVVASGTLSAIADSGTVPAGSLSFVIPFLVPIVDTGGVPAGTLRLDDVVGVFPLDIAEGATGGPAYDTTVVVTYRGMEQRNANILDARLTFNISTGLREYDSLETLIQFFRSCYGSAKPFLFKDWSDYHVEAGPIGTGTGAVTRFQLCKCYVSDLVEVRPITRPIPATASIFLNGVAQSPATYLIDGTTGVLIFNSPPAAGVVITASFDFYIPVRFTSDLLNARWNGTGSMVADSIEVTEIREVPALIPVASPAADPNSRFPDILSMQVGGPLFQTILGKGANGFETSTPVWDQTRLQFKLSASAVPYAYQQSVLAYFRAHKGRAFAWRFKDWTDYDTAGVAYPMAMIDSTHFQLQKPYQLGRAVQRTITSPVQGTVAIHDPLGVVLTDWTCDYTTGRITFDLPRSDIPLASFQFDATVRFDADNLNMRQDELLSYSLSDLPIIEVPDVSTTSIGPTVLSPIAHWSFDTLVAGLPNIGNLYPDVTGNGYDLGRWDLDTVDPSLVPGAIGNAVQFTYAPPAGPVGVQSNACVSNSPINQAIFTTGSFSIAGWFSIPNTTWVSGGVNPPIDPLIFQVAQSPAVAGWRTAVALWVEVQNSSTGSAEIHAKCYNGPQEMVIYPASAGRGVGTGFATMPDLLPNRWYALVVTFDAPTNTLILQISQDGGASWIAAIASGGELVSNTIDTSAHGVFITIGSGGNTVAFNRGPNTTNYNNGAVDAVMVFDHVVSSDEIRAWAASG